MNQERDAGSSTIALKEWASAIGALREGMQILLLRKGGIIEETRDFRLLSPQFYLLPTYEHQRKELVKEEHRMLVERSLEGWNEDKPTVELNTFAEVVEDHEINDQDTLDALRDYHIWTDSFAEERLRWKRKQPLHVLLLRVYRINPEVKIQLRPAYTGCKSWVRLEEEMPDTVKIPVLTDAEFEAEAEKIRSSISKKH